MDVATSQTPATAPAAAPPAPATDVAPAPSSFSLDGFLGDLSPGAASGSRTVQAAGGYAYQQLADGTITATAARAVDEAGLFDASTAGSMFLSATFAVVNLAIGDSLQLTAKAQFT